MDVAQYMGTSNILDPPLFSKPGSASVSHRKLWDTMEQMEFPVHIIQLVANLYQEQESVVRTTNGDTDWFKIERGVR